MAFEDYQEKDSITLAYTGNSKGKTSASLGLMVRALGNDWRVAYIQFIKSWQVSEHAFIEKIMPIFETQLTFYKGGKGFFNAGELSEQAVSDEDHAAAAKATFSFALECATSGDYDLVICDEINNAVYDGLLSEEDLQTLLTTRAPKTSLCVTGRHFPEELLPLVDIATNMTKLKHHFDDKFLAKKGIDF
ncbi:MAG TPA: cob(I)yrinic acid a,c-diamide adenosyltransferase [Verrucomicrobiae bacterium]|nr:cob(I)yrinic acid a,c-diamide adenosyltransferase [Verrucomicrobiae bacterium]